jgi:hypothetical protein
VANDFITIASQMNIPLGPAASFLISSSDFPQNEQCSFVAMELSGRDHLTVR